MKAAELNARFGAPGRIVFRDGGYRGSPEVVLANQYGTAEVALFGATVLSYRPTGHSPVLYRPAKRDYEEGMELHGGIPVCWPQFGRRADKTLPVHGFARATEFEVLSTEYSEEKTEILLGMKSDERTRKIWPHEFKFAVRITVSMKLNLTMTVKNTDKTPFNFNAAFHPYFIISDVDKVTVRGVDGCKYVDGNDPKLEVGTQSGDFKVNATPDHIFTLEAKPKHETAILDAGLRRAIAMVSSGNTKTVVWNVGGEKKLPDLAEGDWRKYVCVEPASEWPGAKPLGAGETYEMMMAIQATMED